MLSCHFYKLEPTAEWGSNQGLAGQQKQGLLQAAHRFSDSHFLWLATSFLKPLSCSENFLTSFCTRGSKSFLGASLGNLNLSSMVAFLQARRDVSILPRWIRHNQWLHGVFLLIQREFAGFRSAELVLLSSVPSFLYCSLYILFGKISAAASKPCPGKPCMMKVAAEPVILWLLAPLSCCLISSNSSPVISPTSSCSCSYLFLEVWLSISKCS